ncbi:response regulator receiver protein [Stanieria cyanosphaera PCC 7437]|uniref:Response regulator receiver protein n=1 Tax=Stanieria cyanosphaera (strain ATCC 29371 / PCC 7437) TaxID=111780 RepID=K9XUY0_STAC7|nr:response regulator [Stanieria cyanosphaera]AFZ35886.1 response regulator receiver protein [Stanieria cyanosphaera PCC 7437]
MVPIKLLLIDDNQDNIILIEVALQRNTNWTVLTASNAIEGITKAEVEIPDVILLDLIMPDLDGLTVYDILKNNSFTRTIPIIFITAMVSTKVLNELEATDVAGIITKPFNTVTLASDISKMCGWNWNIFEKKNRLKTWEICEDEKKTNNFNFRIVPFLI